MTNEKFRSEIRKKFKHESEFAREIGWTRQKLHKAVHGRYSPKISEINMLSRALGISVERFISLFEEEKETRKEVKGMEEKSKKLDAQQIREKEAAALLAFVKRACECSVDKAEIQAMPEAARVLLDLTFHL